MQDGFLAEMKVHSYSWYVDFINKVINPRPTNTRPIGFCVVNKNNAYDAILPT